LLAERFIMHSSPKISFLCVPDFYLLLYLLYARGHDVID
jgi:hypothetical protein